MAPRAPSAALLRTFLSATNTSTSISSQCLRIQTRAQSRWMPAKKYKKVTGLDRLHRRQRDAKVQERIDSQTRASSITFHPPPTPTSVKATPLFPSADSSNPPASANATTQPLQLPYLITRTPSLQLPVYEHAKGGGTKHITVLRKLSGDLDTLSLHLRDALGLAEGFVDAKGRKKEYIRVNQTTRQVIVRGWRAAEVRRWCELAGF